MNNFDLIEYEMGFNYPLMKKVPVDNGWKYSGMILINGSLQDLTVTFDSTSITASTTSSSFNIPIQPNKFQNDALTVMQQIHDKLKTEINRPIIKNDFQMYRVILNEYYEFQNFHINVHKAQLASDLSEINVSFLDDRRREHSFRIKIEVDSDKLFHVANYDLPEFSEKLNFPPDNSLVNLYNTLVSEVDNPKLQEFLDFMEEIDRSCWVLDPAKPRRADVYRRVNLGENIYAVLTYTSLNIKSVPNIQFLGPRKLTSVFEERINNNILNWDFECDDPLHELTVLLGILEFPKKPLEESMDDDLLVQPGECCICFSFCLGEKKPEITCPNTSCNQFFHTECLYKWLSSLNPRRFYFEISEKCPNCEQIIHCPMPRDITE